MPKIPRRHAGLDRRTRMAIVSRPDSLVEKLVEARIQVTMGAEEVEVQFTDAEMDRLLDALKAHARQTQKKPPPPPVRAP